MSWTLTHLPEIGRALVQHLRLVGIATLIATAVAVPLGLAAADRPLLRSLLVGVTTLLYTVPSLALFALLVPLLGLGPGPAIAGLAVYGLLTVLRGTLTGVEGVPPEIREAARGVGLGPLRRALTVELPLAAPLVLAGIRLQIVGAIGIASVAAYVHAGGLGTLILEGINELYPEKIAVGAGLAVALAIVADRGLALLLRRAPSVIA